MSPKQSSKTTAPVAVTAAATTPAAPKKEKAPKTSKVVETAPVVAAVAPVAAAATPKKVKATKVAAPVVATAPVVAAATTETVESAVASSSASVSADFTSFLAKIQQLSTVVSALKSEFRTLEKNATRELKSAAKASQKRKQKKERKGNRSPSGFVKPTLISDELASFLGKDKGTEMARTEVTREINAYIRANQLQDKTNGRRINADTKLSSLLKLASGDELTYFNLQRYMSPHFTKTAAAAVASA